MWGKLDLGSRLALTYWSDVCVTKGHGKYWDLGVSWLCPEADLGVIKGPGKCWVLSVKWL